MCYFRTLSITHGANGKKESLETLIFYKPFRFYFIKTTISEIFVEAYTFLSYMCSKQNYLTVDSK